MMSFFSGRPPGRPASQNRLTEFLLLVSLEIVRHRLELPCEPLLRQLDVCPTGRTVPSSRCDESRMAGLLSDAAGGYRPLNQL
jgi:epoxyqueuosine reductase QueG